MNKVLKSVLAVMIVLLAAESPAFAKWEKVGALDRPIPVQQLQACKFRLKWNVTYLPGINADLYRYNVDASERRNPTSGALTDQSLIMGMDLGLASHVSAIGGAGETPDDAIERIRRENPGTQIFDAEMYMVTFPSYQTGFFFRYTSELGGVQTLSFQLTELNRYVLERECL